MDRVKEMCKVKVRYLKTVSIIDPELRAVEMPRERERSPLICSATTSFTTSKMMSPRVLREMLL